jgi:hypothetical protein
MIKLKLEIVKPLGEQEAVPAPPSPATTLTPLPEMRYNATPEEALERKRRRARDYAERKRAEERAAKELAKQAAQAEQDGAAIDRFLGMDAT